MRGKVCVFFFVGVFWGGEGGEEGRRSSFVVEMIFALSSLFSECVLRKMWICSVDGLDGWT